MPTVFAASIVIFLILRVLPGDVVLVILSGAPHTPEVREALREELGLNSPIVVQYGRWALSMINGEFGGVSLETREPIRSLVRERLPVTLLLTIYVTVVSILISLPLGAVAAVYQKKWQDKLIQAISLGGLSLPVVWTAIIVMAVLLTVFRWSPPVIYTSPVEDLANHMQIMVWPVVLLSWQYGSHIIRITRATMIDNLKREYIATARAKGLGEISVIFRYALRGALIPIATLTGLQVGTMLSGAVVIETIFGLPGIGRGLIGAAISRDLPVVQTIVIIYVVLYILINVVVDLLYVGIDPRIRTDGRA